MLNKHSISAEFLRLVAVAAVCAGILFGVLGLGSTYITRHHFEGDAYVKKKNEEQIAELVSYIEKHQILVGEKQKLTKWLAKHPVVSMQVFKDGTLQYDSAYPDLEDTWSVDPDDYYGWQTYYTVEFADGKADVFISGYYGYQFSVFSMIIRILIAVLVFLVVLVLGIRKTIRYILKLSREIGILESGDLNYEITVTGQNELSDLARGLNAMRISLKERMENEAQIMQNHTKLITEMSHDLRTPLTSILVYTEILKQHACKDDDQLQYYLEKIETRGIQMKQRTDNLFAYALSGDEHKSESLVETCAEAFFERISDMCAYLEEKQFTMKVEEPSVPAGLNVQVNEEYLDRIFDNMVSNLIKYGDNTEPVRIHTDCSDEGIELVFENRIAEEDRYQESTKIGLKNIEKMMRSMGGSSLVNVEKRMFRISLRFPVVS